jgi:ATP-binding protein involved in chromosome partitioning
MKGGNEVPKTGSRKPSDSTDAPVEQGTDERSFEQYLEQEDLSRRMAQIHHKILVLSGKGGVGKSTVAANLAVSLALAGHRTGLLDVDIHGPSIPKLLNIEGRPVSVKDEAIVPIEFGDNLKIMSIGLLLQSDKDAVIWRGPMKMGVIRQFLKDVEWGELDYLIIDSPPGTGDEPLSVCQLVGEADGAIIVTTPQDLAIADVRKAVTFCRTLRMPILGIIENMSGFACPKCGEVTHIFKQGGGERLALEMLVPFLGSIPIDPQIVEASDTGKPYLYFYSKTETAKTFANVVRRVVDATEAGGPAEQEPHNEKGDET